MKRLKVQLEAHMSRVSSDDEVDSFRLSFRDTASKCRVLEVCVPVEALADLLSTRPVEVEGVLYKDRKVGLYKRTMQIGFTSEDYPTERWLASAAARWESSHPGWSIAGRDLQGVNHHRWNGTTYTVTAENWDGVKRED